MIHWLYGIGSRLRTALGLDHEEVGDVLDPLDVSLEDALDAVRDAGPYDFDAEEA